MKKEKKGGKEILEDGKALSISSKPITGTNT